MELLIEDELSDDLGKEKRVALGDFSEVFFEAVRQIDSGENAGKMLGDIVLSQRLELKDIDANLVAVTFDEPNPGWRLFILTHRHRAGRGPTHEEAELFSHEQCAQHHQACFVGEMDVVDEKHQGLPVQEFPDELNQRDEDPLAPTDLVFIHVRSAPAQPV